MIIKGILNAPYLQRNMLDLLATPSCKSFGKAFRIPYNVYAKQHTFTLN